jgi:hypothetical protein
MVGVLYSLVELSIRFVVENSSFHDNDTPHC